jgi:hypothetical protein
MDWKGMDAESRLLKYNDSSLLKGVLDQGEI